MEVVCGHDTSDLNFKLAKSETGVQWTFQRVIPIGHRNFCAECVADALEALGVPVALLAEKVEG